MLIIRPLSLTVGVCVPACMCACVRACVCVCVCVWWGGGNQDGVTIQTSTMTPL